MEHFEEVFWLLGYRSACEATVLTCSIFSRRNGVNDLLILSFYTESHLESPHTCQSSLNNFCRVCEEFLDTVFLGELLFLRSFCFCCTNLFRAVQPQPVTIAEGENNYK